MTKRNNSYHTLKTSSLYIYIYLTVCQCFNEYDSDLRSNGHFLNSYENKA